MNDEALDSLKREFASFSRAVRFTLAALVIGLSYTNIHCALSISGFEAVFRDMFNGQPLPLITRFLLAWRDQFVGLSILLPIASLAAVFWRGTERPVYVIGVLVLLTFGQLIFQWHALLSPLFTIVGNMSGS